MPDPLETLMILALMSSLVNEVKAIGGYKILTHKALERRLWGFMRHFLIICTYIVSI